MINPGEIISYLQMCAEEKVNLQRGMNFRLHGGFSIILMSLRPGAPYTDLIEDNGRILIYEGHDSPRTKGGPDPKTIDQPRETPNGSLTQNGLFKEAALKYKTGSSPPELVKVYEKIRSGIWTYNGIFRLIDTWNEVTNARQVFKFKLEIADEIKQATMKQQPLDHTRLIPTQVKLKVWKRDKGRCVKCGSNKNLEFDHIIPYTKGGSSLVPENIQILCADCNLAKGNKIE